MANVSGGELVVRTLLAAGVDNIFTLYGGHLETIFQSIREHRLAFLDVRHEVAAGHAAEGYARSQRRLGVALITAGPGFTNALTSITNAWLDRTPVLYICASIPQPYAEANVVQGGFDQVAMATPVTKWAHRVTATGDIPRLLAHAMRIATSNPPGPVLLDIPMDVSYATIAADAVPIPGTIFVDDQRTPDGEAIQAALAILAHARRPLIMAGEGAWQCGASDALRRFVARTGIPVFSDYQGVGLLPASDPRYGGGFFKMLELADPIVEPDAVLALGVRFGVYTLGASGLVPNDCKLIHVACDGKEIGRLRDADVAIVGDSAQVLEALLAQAASLSWPDQAPWQRCIADLRTVRRNQFAEFLRAQATPLHPYQAARLIVDNMPSNTIVVADGAEAHQWVAEALEKENPGEFFTHGHLGCLGFGLGFAMGVSRAHPERPVLCVTGDGAVGITLAEFDTMARHRLPVVVAVMNNRCWGATRHFQDLISGPGKNIGVDLGDARYHDAAVALGCQGFHVARPEQLKPAIEAAFACGGPACINIEISLEDMPPDSVALMSHS